MKAPRRKKLLELDRQVLWHPFTQMKDYDQGEEPLIFTRAKGSWLFDGKRAYLDAVSSMWMGTHGHGHPMLDRALKRQLAKAAHTTLLGATHPGAILLAEKLVSLAPEGLTRCFFSDNGSTAVEVAVKMAFQTRRFEWEQSGGKGKPPVLFLTYDGAYHGDTLGAVSVGGVDLFHAAFGPLLFKTVKLPYPTGDLTVHLKELDTALAKHGKELVGAMLEPGLQAAGGMRFMTPGYLKALAERLKAHDLLLVVDEIATGFYRLGSRFAVDEAGVQPDIMAIGKGMTGGYVPIAATLASERVYRAFYDDYEKARHFFHGHTFTGNPLAAAVSLENLRLLEKKSFHRGQPKRTAAFHAALQKLSDHGLVGEVRVKGMAGAVDLVRQKSPNVPFAWEEKAGHRVCLLLRNHGVFCRPLGSTLVFMPPLSLSPDESRFLGEALCKALNDFQKT